jgi:hypothetical protein
MDESTIIARIKELSRDDLAGAIERGILLKILDLKWDEWETKNVGVSRRTGERLIQLVDHPRMRRDDWNKPAQWTVCSEMLAFSDRLFERMIGNDFVNSIHVTRRQVRDFVRAFRRQQFNHDESPSQRIQRNGNMKWLNQVVCGDCLDFIPELPDQSISLVVTSPPYAQQRDEYESVSETAYPEWFCRVMETMRPKLTIDGSVLY